jgi:hypothetical protein
MAAIAQASPALNSRTQIQERLAADHLPGVGVLAMVPARAVYAYLVHFVAIGAFALLGSADPYKRPSAGGPSGAR